MLEELGSRRIATSATGQVASRHDYMPFGEEVLAGTGGRTTAQGYGGNDGVRNKFTGYERDVESGLDYAQAKYFSSKHGRFTSVDPLTASGNIKAPQSLNRYSYANNSPYKFTDSLGLSPQCQGPGGGQGSTLASCDGAGSGTGDDCPAGKTCTIPCSGGAPGCQTDLSAVIATVELKISELMPTAEEVNAVIRELEALEAASEAEIATTITPRALLTIPKFLGAGAVIALTPLPGPGGCQAETGNELCGYPESQAQPQIQPTTTTTDPPSLDGNLTIVRGGESPLPPRGTVFSGAFGVNITDASGFVPHGQIRATTVRAIIESGGSAIPVPEMTRGGNLNMRHVNIVEGIKSTFPPLMPNPVPKANRIQ